MLSVQRRLNADHNRSKTRDPNSTDKTARCEADDRPGGNHYGSGDPVTLFLITPAIRRRKANPKAMQPSAITDEFDGSGIELPHVPVPLPSGLVQTRKVAALVVGPAPTTWAVVVADVGTI